MIFLAADLEPIAAIAAGGGPMKTRPAFAQAAAKCSFHSFNFTKKLDKASPMMAQAALTGMLLPAVTVEVNGERHMLQNVAFVQCTSQPVGGGNAFESYSLNFGRCATHASALAPNNVAHKIDMKVKMDSPNAILIGRPQRAQ